MTTKAILRFARRVVLASAIPLAGFAQPISLSLDLSCDFPWVGTEPVIVDLNTDLPRYLPAHDRPDGAYAGASLSLPSGLAGWWRFMGASTVQASVSLGEPPETNGYSDTIMSLNNFDDGREPASVPGSGPMVVPVAGDYFNTTDRLDRSIDAPETLRIGSAILTLVAKNTSGDQISGSLGRISTACDLVGTTSVFFHTFEPRTLSLSESSIDFGDVRVGDLRQSSVRLNNQSGEPVAVTAVSLSGANADAFQQTNDCSTVASGGSCLVTVTMAPDHVAGNQSATLSLTLSDAASTRLEIPVSATVVEGNEARLTLAPQSLDFGETPLGLAVGRSAELSWQAGSATETTGELTFELTGPDRESFSVSENCDPLYQIGFGEYECRFELGYQPSSLAQHEATLTVSAADSSIADATLSLSGIGSAQTSRQVDMDMNPVFGSDRYSGPLVGFSGSLTANVSPDDAAFSADVTGGSIGSRIDLNFSYWLLLPMLMEVVEPLSGRVDQGHFTGEMTVHFRSPFSSLQRRSWFQLYPVTVNDYQHENCRTVEPVTIHFESLPGESFNWQSGGKLLSRFVMNRMANCGSYTGRYNEKFQGTTNLQPWTIALPKPQ